MEIQQAKQMTAETGRMLLEQGLVARTWGNVSCRVDDTHYVITPSGLDYVNMTPEDIVMMDLATGTWEGKHKPSGERGVHSAAYQTYPEVTFVIHTHQTYATAIGLAGFESLSMTEMEEKQLGGVALAGYGLPGTKKLTNHVMEALKSGAKVVLMAHHGALICGKNREDAMLKAILLEKICKQSMKGQPKNTMTQSSEVADQIMKKVREVHPQAQLVQSPAVLQLARMRKRLKSQVDDMAQMIGPYLTCVDAYEDKVLAALEKKDAILIPSVGAVVKEANVDDAKALAILVEKAAICSLHTQALGKKAGLSWFDTRLMRLVYKMKYSKQK